MSTKKIFARSKLQENQDSGQGQEVVASHQSVSEDTNNEDDPLDRREIGNAQITYAQLYQLLLTMLANNRSLLKEVLKCAQIMFKEGLRTSEIGKLLVKQPKRSKPKSRDDSDLTKKKSRSR